MFIAQPCLKVKLNNLFENLTYVTWTFKQVVWFLNKLLNFFKQDWAMRG